MPNIDSMNRELLIKELKLCYNYFANEANWNKNSRGYGLVRDKSAMDLSVSSIAAVGFGLASLVTAVKHDWISVEEAYQKADGTLNTFLNNVDNINGFYNHFLNMNTGTREWNSEISIIDSGILICGAITAGEFFKDGVQEKADKLYRRINWEWFVDKNRNMFYLGNNPESGFYGNWDVYAEQLILYILSAGSPTCDIGSSLYDCMQKPVGEYKDYKNIIHSWYGSLFTYQFSHAWVDFRDTEDKSGINWFDNSVKATLANRQYCIDNQHVFKTFSENFWGLSATLSPNGYNTECGVLPASCEFKNDGTIAPYGAVSSIVFTPDLSMAALQNFYENYPVLVGEYGLKSAFNPEQNPPWVSPGYLGIDKGITLCMIENYLNESIWQNMMQNECVQKGMGKLYVKKARNN